MAQNEINRLKNINHPRIVDYYGFKIDGSSITIFMEYMAAGSLKQIIDKFGPIKEGSVSQTYRANIGRINIHSRYRNCSQRLEMYANGGRGHSAFGCPKEEEAAHIFFAPCWKAGNPSFSVKSNGQVVQFVIKKRMCNSAPYWMATTLVKFFAKKTAFVFRKIYMRRIVSFSLQVWVVRYCTLMQWACTHKAGLRDGWTVKSSLRNIYGGNENLVQRLDCSLKLHS